MCFISENLYPTSVFNTCGDRIVPFAYQFGLKWLDAETALSLPLFTRFGSYKDIFSYLYQRLEFLRSKN